MIFSQMAKFPEDKIPFLLKGKKEKNNQKDLIIREGGRHTHMVSLAGFYRHKGYSSGQIFALLDTANSISFDGKILSDDEMEDIAGGCGKYQTLYEEYTVNLDDVEEKPMECVIAPYISRYDTNMLEGEPGAGKSTLLAELAACITTGKEFCGVKPSVVGDVLFFAIEDNLGTVFKARARLQGADFKRIDVVDGYLGLGEEGFNYLEQALSKKQYALVIIDTLTSSLVDQNMNSGGDMARLIRQLTQLARDYQTTFLAVRHFRKAGAEQSGHIGMGSIAITGGVRSSMMLKVCPEDDSKRYLAHNKSNGLKKGPTLTFVIQDAPNESSGIGQLVWTGTSELTSEDLVLMVGKTVKKKDEATAFLEEILSQGPVDKKTVQRKALAQGHSDATLRRAKKELGIKSCKQGTVWAWHLK